jgi:hypothetical protein
MSGQISPMMWEGSERKRPELLLGGVLLTAAAVALITAWKLSTVLILPVLSVVLLSGGFTLAVAVWRRPVPAGQLCYRDVAAALVFCGFAAALLSDTAALAPLFNAAP